MFCYHNDSALLELPYKENFAISMLNSKEFEESPHLDSFLNHFLFKKNRITSLINV